jgi:phage baseplate assembly protein W
MIKATYFGFNPPFLTASGQIMPVQTDERLVKNDLLQLLLTVPGERPFRPNFGSPVKQALFEPADALSTSNLRNGIARAVTLNEPRVTLTEIRVNILSDINKLQIKLFGFLTISPNIQLQLDLNLPFMAAA